MTQASMLRIENREDLIFGTMNPDSIQKILGNVVYDKAFFFYEDIGKPTGDFAINLSDFCNKIKTISPKIVAFHLKRGDFENWIREIIGDSELSQRIKKLKTNKRAFKSQTTLRNKLHVTVRDRIAELKDLWHQALKRPEALVARP